VLKARILLKADASEAGEAWSDSQIAEALDTSVDTIERSRQQLVEGGIDAAPTRKQSPPLRPKAHLRRRRRGQANRPRLFCATEGAQAVDADAAGNCRGGTEYRRSRQRQHDRAYAQKNILKPLLQKQWVIPPAANAAFVAAMEDVLEVYQRPHDPDRPVVCLDETTKQLVKETRTPVPATPGRPARHDYEYERNGTINLFMLFASLEGWQHVEVTDRHTALDYAQVLKNLSDRHFPGASKIVLMQDNLSTHKPASLYEAFPPAEARRLVERFEWHYTPRHGGWLDMAESELSVLSGQCLDRRIPDKQTLIEEVAAWQEERNKHHTRADWQFTTADARIKLKRLYPAL
jgi:DDE superfamily endonuclease